MTIWRLTLLVALLLSYGCTLTRLDSEITRAYNEYGYIKVSPQLPQDSSQTILVALYQEIEGNHRLVNLRSITSNDQAVFLVPIGRYNVIAFGDSNNDFIYQPGEPVATLENLAVNPIPPASDQGSRISELPAYHLELSTKASVAYKADLSSASLQANLKAYEERFLSQVSWSDDRFSDSAVKTGMWQPLKFLEDIGYGLYRTSPLDPSRDQLVFVHGINGSPTQFKPLATSLGKDYQTLLFQYPSGASLDLTAYTLRVALSELVARYPKIRVHLIAHSMGGLVARGAIVLNSKKTTDAIDTFVTISTPWAGHTGAEAGVKWSPAVAPVWKGMMPYSDYQKEIFAKPLPENIDHLLLFSFAQERGGEGKRDDGVVTISSQLYEPAQDQSRTVRGIADNHNGILENKKSFKWIQRHLHQ